MILSLLAWRLFFLFCKNHVIWHQVIIQQLFSQKDTFWKIPGQQFFIQRSVDNVKKAIFERRSDEFYQFRVYTVVDFTDVLTFRSVCSGSSRVKSEKYRISRVSNIRALSSSGMRFPTSILWSSMIAVISRCLPVTNVSRRVPT